jgi:hypothetical protein
LTAYTSTAVWRIYQKCGYWRTVVKEPVGGVGADVPEGGLFELEAKTTLRLKRSEWKALVA